MPNRAKNPRKAKAWEHFYPEGHGYAKEGYVLHHVDETMKNNDWERYKKWNPEDLVMITREEHSHLHHKDKVASDETKQRISINHADVSGDKNPMWHHVYSEETLKKMSEKAKGRKHTEEAKQKMSDVRKGELSYWWTNGEICVRGKTAPEGFVRGRVKK